MERIDMLLETKQDKIDKMKADAEALRLKIMVAEKDISFVRKAFMQVSYLAAHY